jgi:hypothetical protein
MCPKSKFAYIQEQMGNKSLFYASPASNFTSVNRKIFALRVIHDMVVHERSILYKGQRCQNGTKFAGTHPSTPLGITTRPNRQMEVSPLPPVVPEEPDRLSALKKRDQRPHSSEKRSIRISPGTSYFALGCVWKRFWSKGECFLVVVGVGERVS